MLLTIPELRKQLKNYRKKYRLSQKDVADAIGVSIITIFRFESWAQETSGEKIIKIYEYLVNNHIKETLSFTIEYKDSKKKV